MAKRSLEILLNVFPVLLMVALVPWIRNDFVLTLVFILIIAASFLVKRIRHDFLFLLMGFFVMIIGEYIFISTGVETFVRNSLFGIMPLWLPFLWGYAFVAMKRSIEILNSNVQN